METRVVSPAFIGRTEALARLVAAFQAAAGSGPRVALVAGEAGIGKSRLVAEFTASLGRVRVAAGGCTALDGEGLAYAPIVAALRELVREHGADYVAAATGVELARWFPELGRAASGGRRADPGFSGGGAGSGTGESGAGRPRPDLETWTGAASDGKLRLYEDVLGLIEFAAARRPLVFVVEDLHWADPATAELLGFLARNLTRPGVLLLATYRDTEAATAPPPATGSDATMTRLLAELHRHPHTLGLRLGPLTRHEVGRQLAAIRGDRPDPAMVRRIHQRSDGNPLFVEAIAQTGEPTGAGLPELLLQVPRSLPDGPRRLLAAAAVAGEPVGHELLAEVTGRNEAELDPQLRELIHGGLLVVVEDGYAFRHDLIRQAVYQDLLPGERRRLHARFAEALHDNGSVDQLAAHTHAAGQVGAAFDAAWRAAVEACGSYAYWQEARMLDRVLSLWDAVPDAAERLGVDRVDIHEYAAECCMLSGDYVRGIDYATTGLAAIDPETDRARAARLLEHRGRLRDRVDATGMADLERAGELLETAAADPDGPAGRAGERFAKAGATDGSVAGGPEPAPSAASGRAMPRRAAAGSLATEPISASALARGRLLGLRAMAALRSDVDKAGELAAEALAAGRAGGDPVVTIRGLLGTGYVTDDAELLAEAVAIAERIRDHDLLITALMYQVLHHHRNGEYDAAAAAAREGMRRAARLGLTRSRGTFLAGYLAKSLIQAGHWDEAAELIDTALAEDPPPMPGQLLRVAATHLAVLRGDLAAAAGFAATLPEADERLGAHFLYRRRVECLAALANGEVEAADEMLRRTLAGPALTSADPVEARPLLVAGALVQHARLDADDASSTARLGELAAVNRALPVRGRLDTAWHDMLAALTTPHPAADWDRVVASWRELGQPYELAQSLHFAARATGEPAPRDEAFGIIARLGAGPLPSAEPDRRDSDPADTAGLSPRELEVLALIAEGLSNRQIAARLFIAPSTAGVHVSHILAKLNAATRAEAASLAHRRGLLDG